MEAAFFFGIVLVFLRFTHFLFFLQSPHVAHGNPGKPGIPFNDVPMRLVPNAIQGRDTPVIQCAGVRIDGTVFHLGKVIGPFEFVLRHRPDSIVVKPIYGSMVFSGRPMSTGQSWLQLVQTVTTASSPPLGGA